MYSNLTIIIFLIAVILLWKLWTLKWVNKKITSDDFLVQNYHKKPSFQKRLVLIIETFENLEDLLALLRNILQQDIKVDSIILITKNKDLNKVELVQNTCTINKVGGLTFLLKESGSDTILVFIFPDGFNAFVDPQFLKKFLSTNSIDFEPKDKHLKINGLVMVGTNSVNVDVQKLYE